jgi:hypothetical protein
MSILMKTQHSDENFPRLKSLLPRWFGDDTPVLDALLQGAAHLVSVGAALIRYATAQTRLKTAAEGWLELIAHDFLGRNLVRQVGQSDEAFRGRILASLFRERATRAGLIQLLTELTGQTPKVFEPNAAGDTAAYGMSHYGIGRYGGRALTYQVWVTIHRPHEASPPLEAGFYAQHPYGRSRYASHRRLQSALPDHALLQAVHQLKPMGTVVWVRLI